ncbi:hypothetical protein JW711_04035 [Candidatus Woesearchaeota archaeon]|nr:hypothetical protein [Candidatus Woesearchaeota archaeon]
MKLKDSLKTGVSFGLTSGTITTLGLMVGLDAAANSRMIVIGGILTLALADSFSDALGIHMSAESRKENAKKVWESTVATFLTKVIYTLTYAIPVIIFSLPLGIYVAMAWGLIVISALSYAIALNAKENPLHVIGEHVLIAIIVVALSHYVGLLIASVFG